MFSSPYSVDSPAYDRFTPIPSNLTTFPFNLSPSIRTFLRRLPSVSDVSLPLHTLTTVSTAAATALMISSISWLLYSMKKKKKKMENRGDINTPATLINDAVAGDSPEQDEQKSPLPVVPTTNDGKTLFPSDDLPVSDVNYAEELQVQEALLASLLASQSTENGSSSSDVGDPPEEEKLCEICFETKEKWQMFTNQTCPHSFCYECTTKHVVSKIKDNAKKINCPGINCSKTLDFDACRMMIPREVVVRWDEFLCESLILDSRKLYCPFRDCLAMLVDDSGQSQNATEIKCPICRRSFCGTCLVPWHSEFSCEEFRKLSAKRWGKGKDAMVQLLAKKKNWQKCPRCKMIVEKTEGCLHIICRCDYQFCYRCGSKWGGSHSNCRRKT